MFTPLFWVKYKKQSKSKKAFARKAPLSTGREIT